MASKITSLSGREKIWCFLENVWMNIDRSPDYGKSSLGSTSWRFCFVLESVKTSGEVRRGMGKRQWETTFLDLLPLWVVHMPVYGPCQLDHNACTSVLVISHGIVPGEWNCWFRKTKSNCQSEFYFFNEKWWKIRFLTVKMGVDLYTSKYGKPILWIHYHCQTLENNLNCFFSLWC